MFHDMNSVVKSLVFLHLSILFPISQDSPEVGQTVVAYENHRDQSHHPTMTSRDGYENYWDNSSAAVKIVTAYENHPNNSRTAPRNITRTYPISMSGYGYYQDDSHITMTTRGGHDGYLDNPGTTPKTGYELYSGNSHAIATRKSDSHSQSFNYSRSTPKDITRTKVKRVSSYPENSRTKTTGYENYRDHSRPKPKGMTGYEYYREHSRSKRKSRVGKNAMVL